MTRAKLAALLAVIGPGLLAGLSDDDPAGITTYSILGADHGYRLLWVLVLSTVALVLFHELAARTGIVTGQGLIGLARERYGVRIAAAGLAALLVANVGTACAELAGVAVGFELAGVSRYASVPVAALVISVLVLTGGFRRVEHVLLALAAVFAAYLVAGVVAGPDWGAAGRGLVVPNLPADRDAILAATAVVGTTLAPWGLAFIQSYAVDKRLRAEDLRFARLDIVVGSALTGVIGAMVVIACAATLHRDGRSIEDAGDAARALEPLAGSLASTLFAVGLVGAALLATAVLPLATAYSTCEFLGQEAKLNDRPRDAPTFYLTFVGVIVVAGLVVLAPGVSLVPILYLTQVLNAVLLLPILVLMIGVGRDRRVMGAHAVGRRGIAVLGLVTALVAVCVAALGVSALFS